MLNVNVILRISKPCYLHFITGLDNTLLLIINRHHYPSTYQAYRRCHLARLFNIVVSSLILFTRSDVLLRNEIKLRLEVWPAIIWAYRCSVYCLSSQWYWIWLPSMPACGLASESVTPTRAMAGLAASWWHRLWYTLADCPSASVSLVGGREDVALLRVKFQLSINL